MKGTGIATACALCLLARGASADTAPTLEASSLGGAGSLATNADFTLISSWRQQVQTSVSSGGEYVHFSGFVGAFTDPQVMLDTDGDGLTDIEEVTGNRFTPAQPTSPTIADTDGDGATDLAELIAGTNPQDNASRFDWFPFSGTNSLAGGFQLTIPTVPGRRYAIAFADALDASSTLWTPFLNTNEGVGVYTEGGGVPSTFTFTDDFTLNTSGSAPSNLFRAYRVSISLP